MDELLILGVQLLAAVHAGVIDFNCDTCTDDRKEALCCSGESKVPIFVDEELGEFYNCPLRWISLACYTWYDEYSYYQVFEGTAPKYGEHNRRFWEITKVYKNAYDKYSEIKRKRPPHGEAETTNSLAKLRQSFKRRKK